MTPPECADWYTWRVVERGILTFTECERADLLTMERAHLALDLRELVELG